MKTVLIAVLALCFMAAAGDSPASDSHRVAERVLGGGAVRVYDFGALRLHAYQTGDPMADECFLVETDRNLVAMESPSFAGDIETWKDYVHSLDKPLTDILVSSHPTGGKWYGTAKSHATAATVAAITEGDIKALVSNLGQAFGPDFSVDIPPIDSVIAPGRNTIGGVDFEISQNGGGYDIAIPAIEAVYTHMLGADTHSILAGTDHMAQVLETLNDFRTKQYVLILSSHHTPEDQTDLAAKIAYVAKARETAGKAGNRDDFIAEMNRAFPGYKGLNYLEMTAGMMFP